VEQGLRAQAKLLDHDVEGAPIAAMAPEDILDIEGRRAEAFADRRDFRGGYEQKQGIGIDETTDQPGTGDAVDLGPRPSDPDGASEDVAGRKLVFRHSNASGC
jgi:hypothetical protein